MKTLRALRRTVAQIYRLARLSSGGPGWQTGLLLCGLILAAKLADIYITVAIINWSKAFFDALEKINVAESVRQVGIFFLLIGISASIFLAAQYVQKIVFIRWRSRLNSIVLSAWLDDKTYWKLQPSFSEGGIENPDQRISEDCRLFVDALLEQTIGLVSRVIGLATYLWVLWSLSSFPLQFSVLGLDVTIPRYMVWAAFLYVLLSSLLTHGLGFPLKDLLFAQQRREADYRFALTRVRDSAEAVALANGEAAERRVLDRRFNGIMENWHRVIVREFLLGLFTRPYFQTVLRIPLFLALPAYLAGKLTLGGLMQMSGAFSNVVTSLSWFIFEYRDLSNWVATSNRLSDFLDKAEMVKRQSSQIRLSGSDDNALAVSGLVLRKPNGDALTVPTEFRIEAGERVWLSGDSGIGKSTLLKALAGLWPLGSGAIEYPRNWKPVFLSQDIYLPLGNLRESASYPLDPESVQPGRLDAFLQAVGLDHRSDQPGFETEELVKGLSGGEKQRLAFSRILAAQPDWVFLDESTSALDKAAEKQLLELLFSHLPQTTVIFVAHHKPCSDANWREIRVGP